MNRSLFQRQTPLVGFNKFPEYGNIYTAKETRKAIKGVQNAPFKNLQEITTSTIKEKVGTHLAYIFKRYHTGKGDDFESVAAIVNNPNLPMDCSSLGILTRDSPIWKAMLKYGGHFFTVNLSIPPDLGDVINLNTGKGRNWVQLDYLIIIPGNVPKFVIIEFKAGSGQLYMAAKEAEQMIKAGAIFRNWVGPIQLELYYSPFLASQASVWKNSHTSTEVHYLTSQGLAKLLRIPLNSLTRIGNLRTNFQTQFTIKLYKIQKKVVEELATESVEKVLTKNLQTKSSANLGKNLRKLGNFSADKNYKTSRALVTQLLVKREALRRKYLQNSNNATARQVLNVTSQILGIHNRTPVLSTNAAINLRTFVNSVKNAYKNVQIPTLAHTVETAIEERAEVLGSAQYQLAALNDRTNFVPKKDIDNVQLNKVSQGITKAVALWQLNDYNADLNFIRSRVNTALNNGKRQNKINTVSILKNEIGIKRNQISSRGLRAALRPPNASVRVTVPRPAAVKKRGRRTNTTNNPTAKRVKTISRTKRKGNNLTSENNKRLRMQVN
jgi:hypothetical protein